MASIQQRVAAGLLVLSTTGALGIIAHEGLRKVAYVDPVGVVTICSGHTKTAKLGQTKTEAECAALLKDDVKDAERAVKRLVTTPLTQRQFDAITSFVFNVGESNFASSTLLKKINNNDCWGAGAEFMRWNRAGGKVLPGLTTRRASERVQWETGCPRGNYLTSNTSTSKYTVPVAHRLPVRRPEPHAFAVLARSAQPPIVSGQARKV